MGKGMGYTFFIYFLCFSFLLLTGGFPKMAAQAGQRGLPIGEMISRGEVKFEARKNAWKKVEPSHFPIFQGVRIKTEKGVALIVLADGSQIDVDRNSLFSFQHHHQFTLLKGGISFRIPSGAEMSFKVGDLSIGKPLELEATKGPLISQRNEETIGSITLHPTGSVTVKSIRGPLSIQNQESLVLGAISSGESVGIPYATASDDVGQMITVDDQYPTGKALTDEFLGLSKATWMFIALGAVAAVGAGIYLGVTKDDDDEFLVPVVPICP